MLLNPSTSNFYITFTKNFFSDEIDAKYNDFLFHMNSPMKDIIALIIESIQQIEIPGDDMETITASNLGGINGHQYTTSGNANQTAILDSTIINITSRNILINYMRLLEFKNAYYARDRKVGMFDFTVTFCDSADVPLMSFMFLDCFIRAMPGLTFAYNSEFNESKTFDWKLQFSRFTPTFIIPDFKKNNLQL